MNPGRRMFWIPILLLGLGVAAVVAVLAYDGRGSEPTRVAGDPRIPIAMMGDSDTEPYQKHTSIWTAFRRAEDLPGGDYNDITWQWPEVLARIRTDQVDLGPWGFWGVPRPFALTRVRELLGQRWRGPYRETFRHSLAWASPCWSIVRGPWAQAPQLRDLMDENPAAWRRGVVVIRIGVGTFGMVEHLAPLAKAADDPQERDQIDECVAAYEQAIVLLREHHPDLRFVVVGVLNNADWTKYLHLWHSPAELANISTGLDRFDNGLRQLARRHPGVAFFDDRAWFARHWGGRGADGEPAYRYVDIPGTPRVGNTAGNAPHNAVLANQHAGTVWNVLWVQALVDLMRNELGVVELTPIGDDEKATFIRAALEAHAAQRPPGTIALDEALAPTPVQGGKR